MSDLAATNCGCGRNDGGCGSILWLIVLLSLCNGGGSGLFGNNDGCGCGDNSCIWIILLLLCCGGCGSNSFCG